MIEGDSSIFALGKWSYAEGKDKELKSGHVDIVVQWDIPMGIQ